MREGWFRTGDLATRAEGGYVRIVGRRATDLIKSGGYKIGAGEIEAALREHDAVDDAAVTGEGRALIDRVTEAHMANEARLLEGLSAHEREQLAGLLRKLALTLPSRP